MHLLFNKILAILISPRRAQISCHTNPMSFDFMLKRSVMDTMQKRTGESAKWWNAIDKAPRGKICDGEKYLTLLVDA